MTTIDDRAGTKVGNPSEEPIDILLVEPNPGDARLFSESFKEASITNQIYVVSDTESALEFLQRRGEYADVPTPDLLLIDPHVPGSATDDVLSELNDEPALRDVSVAVLTSSAGEEEIIDGREFDADGFFRKPVEADEFVEFVRSVEEFWFTIVRRSPEERSTTGEE